MAVDLGALVVRLQADMKGFNSGLNKAQERLRTFSARLQGSMQANAQAMQRFGRTAVLVGAAVQGALVGMVKKFGDFELAMRKATTATDITMQEFGELTEFVEEQATKLNIAAVEAAEGLKFLGFAGLTAKQQMEAFPPLLKLSKAGMAEMGLVAQRILGVMGALGVSFDETGRVADQVAKIWGSSQATLEDLTTTFSFAAASLKGMGLSLAEIGALSAIMAQAHIIGSRAGTTLRRTFLNLKAPTSELRTLLADLGIKTEDANGKFRNGIDVLDDFFKATEKMGDAQRAMAFKVAFGARAVEGMTVVANKGIKSLRDFAEAVENADGTVDIMVERRMKALNEQLGIASRRFAKLFRLIGSQFEPEAKLLADTMQDVVSGMTDWIKANSDLTKSIAATIFVAGNLTSAMGSLVFGMAALGLAATALGTTMGLLAIKLAAATGGLTLIAALIAKVIIDNVEFRAEVKLAQEALDALNKSLDAGEVKWKKWDAALRSSAEGLGILRRKITAEANIRKIEEDLATVLAIDTRAGMDKVIRQLLPFAEQTGTKFGLRSLKTTQKQIIETIRLQLDVAKKAFDAIGTEAKSEFKRVEDAAAALVPEVERSMSALERAFTKVGESIGDSMVDNLADSLLAVQTWSEAVLNIVNDMTQQITRAFTRMFLQEVFQSTFFNTPGGLNFGNLLFPIAQPAATQAFTNGGVVQPAFAANGFVAKGKDTALVMASPGEVLLNEAQSSSLLNQRQQDGGVNITIQAIDTQTGIQFLLRNKNVIASALQSAGQNNHPFRRGQG